MTGEEFTAWAREHVLTFGMGTNAMDMILSWFPAMNASGYTVEELATATQTMVTRPPFPTYPADHLKIINGHVSDLIRARMSQRMSEHRSPGDFRGQCTLCADSGWVSVPHPMAVENGKWTSGLSMGVACYCWKGSETAKGHEPSNKGTRKVPMTLTEYQKIHPNWKALMEVRADAQALMSEASAKQGSGRDIVLRLAKHMKLPRRAS